MTEKDKAIAIVNEYTGGRVISAQAWADPYILGCYAVRAKLEGDEEEMDCILNINEGEDSVEECEFETWPPKSDPYNLNPFNI